MQPRKRSGGYVGGILSILTGTRYHLVSILQFASRGSILTVKDLEDPHISAESLGSRRMLKSEAQQFSCKDSSKVNGEDR